jgi:hypothetical protein
VARRAWIQFATLVSARPVAHLRQNLKRVAAADSTVVTRHRRSGRPFQVVRSVPFATVKEARLRLRELEPAMKTLNLRPIIIVGPYQPVAPEATYLADGRKPE